MSLITFNGVNGSTGQYMVPPMSDTELVNLITGREAEEAESLPLLRSLDRKWSTVDFGVRIGSDPTKIADVGWGILFHEEESEAVQQALTPLLQHRASQVGDDEKVKVLTYASGQTAAQWLAEHDVSRGSIEPFKVPMYLLVVGDPARIPFQFTSDLDVEYAVGRLHFESAPEYAHYAQSVIDYETGASAPTQKEMAVFGTQHPFDDATNLSSKNLLSPLVQGMANYPAVAEKFGFRQQTRLAEGARKGALMNLLGAPNAGSAPALLLTATHGVPFDWDDPKQPANQGALLCQDWPALGTIDRPHYFSAQDVPLDGHVHGMIAFLFGCFSMGTPTHDQYLHRPGEAPPQIAARPFIAQLPKTLLAHPNGGALACIGHVERAWGASLETPAGNPQLLPFYNAMGKILLGQPVGCALMDFNERYAALSVSLADKLENRSFGTKIPDWELASDWLGRNDAGGYMLVGDPAVRLRSADLA